MGGVDGQIDLDQLDQNEAVNKAGQVLGSFTGTKANISDTALAPYSEVFGLQRFRECELIHGRWALLATLGRPGGRGLHRRVLVRWPLLQRSCIVLPCASLVTVTDTNLLADIGSDLRNQLWRS